MNDQTTCGSCDFLRVIEGKEYCYRYPPALVSSTPPTRRTDDVWFSYTPPPPGYAVHPMVSSSTLSCGEYRKDVRVASYEAVDKAQAIAAWAIEKNRDNDCGDEFYGEPDD